MFIIIHRSTVQSRPDPPGHGQRDSGSTLVVWTGQSQLLLAALYQDPTSWLWHTPLFRRGGGAPPAGHTSHTGRAQSIQKHSTAVRLLLQSNPREFRTYKSSLWILCVYGNKSQYLPTLFNAVFTCSIHLKRLLCLYQKPLAYVVWTCNNTVQPKIFMIAYFKLFYFYIIITLHPLKNCLILFWG